MKRKKLIKEAVERMERIRAEAKRIAEEERRRIEKERGETAG